MTQGLPHVPRRAVQYLGFGLVLALAAGGGYAMAASNNKTITVCADKTTGVLHLKTRGRCRTGQTRVSWNQQGPQGVQGSPGPTGLQGPTGPQGLTGAQGPAGVTVWANVADDGTVLAGQGVAVQRMSAGDYQVTITDSRCAREANAPVVSVSDAAPGMVQGGVFPSAWYETTGLNQQFMVFTGVVSAGPAFTPTNHAFDVLDTCQ
jgi:hypothetical protein